MSAVSATAKTIARALKRRSPRAVSHRIKFLGIKRAYKIAPKIAAKKYGGATQRGWLVIMRAHKGAVREWKIKKAEYNLKGPGFVL